VEELLDKPTSHDSDKSTSHDLEKEKIKAVLKVLQTERDRNAIEEEDRNEMGDSIGASVTHQDEKTTDGAGQLRAQVNNALNILVRNATEEFGFAPRDVYEGILDIPSARHAHAAALRKLDYSKLLAIVDAFSEDCELNDVSHRVVALQC